MPSKILQFSVKKEVLRDSTTGTPIVSSQKQISLYKNCDWELYEIKRGYDLEESYNLIQTKNHEKGGPAEGSIWKLSLHAWSDLLYIYF